MARGRKKIVLEEKLDLPEFGFLARDEDGILLVVKSNAGGDKGLYLEEAKKLDRQICVSIEADIFDTYQFKMFALNKEETRNLIRELTRMLDYLED